MVKKKHCAEDLFILATCYNSHESWTVLHVSLQWCGSWGLISVPFFSSMFTIQCNLPAAFLGWCSLSSHCYLKYQALSLDGAHGVSLERPCMTVSSAVSVLAMVATWDLLVAVMSLKNEKLIPFREQRENYIAGSLRKCHFKLDCANIKPHDLKFSICLINDKTCWKIEAANVRFVSSECSCLIEEVAWNTLHLLRQYNLWLTKRSLTLINEWQIWGRNH